MFGLKAFFSSLSRLTTAVTRSAELFEIANTHLEQQLGFDRPDTTSPALEHNEIEPESNGLGKRRKATAK